MWFTMNLALVLALTACKPDATPAPPASGSGSAAMPTAQPAPIDAAVVAPTPWQVPSAAKPVTGDADATALGTAITAHLVERVSKQKAGGGRSVQTVLVLEGKGSALAADETDEGSAQDGSKATRALVGEADVVLPPLTPPRPASIADLPNDAMPELDFKGPLLFVAKFSSKGEKRALAIAHDHDTIMVWTMVAPSDSIDVPPSWSVTGTIKLAAGANVITPALAGKTTGTLAATSLDDLLASRRIERDHVARRADHAGSQWAVVEDKRPTAGDPPSSYTVIRVTAAGPSTVELVAPGPDGWFEGVAAIDVEDLDNDGIDDAVITASWTRLRSQRELTTTEKVDQIYVVGGAQLSIGAQHASQYKTETNLGPYENAQPEESIAFTYSIEDGTLHIKRGASSIEHKRVKGLLAPRRDPSLLPGDLSITFK